MTYLIVISTLDHSGSVSTLSCLFMFISELSEFLHFFFQDFTQLYEQHVTSQICFLYIHIAKYYITIYLYNFNTCIDRKKTTWKVSTSFA